MKAHDVVWNEENVAELRRLWVTDIPVQDMVKHMRRFTRQPHLTRNVIYGKAHRLGLPARSLR